ncbi:MAG TPA: hypothetical protein VN703_10095 [Candidatus Sulfopaludibacter sp.]|jgi:hypothetical protein|nr:hypothetical protein [Candidatus Sulfopaludibacter sp.]
MENKNNQIKENSESSEISTETNLVSKSMVSETDKYTIHKDVDGKYSRRAKYIEFSSITASSREEKIWLLNLLEGAEDSGYGMKEHVGETIEVQDIVIRPYDSIDEFTGELEYGVLTYLITPDRKAYVTSAKSVYFSINRIMEVFGKPNTEEWENVKVLIGKTKMENGDAINIKMVG